MESVGICRGWGCRERETPEGQHKLLRMLSGAIKEEMLGKVKVVLS